MGIKDRLAAANAAAKDKAVQVRAEQEAKKAVIEQQRAEAREIQKAEGERLKALPLQDRMQKRLASLEVKKQGYRETRAAQSGVDTTGALFLGESHEGGRNSMVTLYSDRLERVQAKKLTSLSNARQDVEITPVRAMTSVQAKKDGMMFTKVTVYASANNIDFRFTHAEAARFKDVLTGLLLAPAPGAPTPTVDLADQLTKLAGLRDQGILSDAEFAAQKAKLLA